MSFDARSKERLEALGRTLPQKLPLPTAQRPGSPAVPTAPSPQHARHAVEREEDPVALFRALMAASPDGTVPPHHLERLRELEATRQRPTEGPSGRGPAPSATPGPTLIPPATSAKAKAKASASRPSGTPAKVGSGGNRRPAQNQGGDADLYSAFAQLLLEEDGDDDGSVLGRAR